MTATDFIVARDDFETCKAIATTFPSAAALPQARQVYLDTLKGRIPPEQGHMLSPPG